MKPAGKPVRGGLRTALWGAWVITAFVGTHMPPPEQQVAPLLKDKLLHFVGFATLGILTFWRITGGVMRVRPQVMLLWYLGLVAYGLFDEATQPLVGRTFEWTDWAADVCGATTGILVGVLCHRWTLKTGMKDEG